MVSSILLVGVGFFLGVLFSVGIVERMHRELGKKYIKEVTAQYNKISQGLIDKLNMYKDKLKEYEEKFSKYENKERE
jgi:hypothetical protein